MKDQNTLVLRAFSKGKTHEADEVYELVMKQFSKAKNATGGDAPSRADALTKLAELYRSGILSEEEFQREKAKLLGR